MHNDIRQLYFLQLFQCDVVRYHETGGFCQYSNGKGERSAIRGNHKIIVQLEIEVFRLMLTKRFLQPETRLDMCNSRGPKERSSTFLVESHLPLFCTFGWL